WNGSRLTTRSCGGATTGSTSRGTTRATCAGTRSSRSGTPAAPSTATSWPHTRRATTSSCTTTLPGHSAGSRSGMRPDPQQLAPLLSAAALAFDALIVCAYAVVYSYEYGSPTRWALIVVIAEASLRYGLVGGLGLPIVLIPFFVFAEWWRAHRFGPPGFRSDRVTFPAGIMLLTGTIMGRLVERLDREAALAGSRAAEAERLRDELGRRVDLLEAANRCARALGSSLEVEQAFGAFIRELRGLVPFDRTTIVLVENDHAEVMATAGLGAETVFPPGTVRGVKGSVLEEIMAGRTVVRRDM